MSGGDDYMRDHVRRAEAVRKPPRSHQRTPPRSRQSSFSLGAVEAAAAAADEQATKVAQAKVAQAMSVAKAKAAAGAKSAETQRTGAGEGVSASRSQSTPIPEPTLDLSGQSLLELPSTLNLSRLLVGLDASDNRISKLPAELLLLCQCLRTLNLKRNMLKELPDALVALAALRSLDCSENQLRSLPSGVGKLGLLTLSAAENQLVSLPESLVEMMSLVELDVGGNQLTQLPQGIGSLPSLVLLVVSENLLTELPESVFEAPSLKDLRCMKNSFSAEAQRAIDTKASIFRFTDPEHIYAALRPLEEDEKQDRDLPLVLLVRSSWLVKRAEALERALAEAGDDEEAAAAARKKWALPRRQDLLLQEPEAFIHEEELRGLTPKRARGRIAVGAVSQCVERPTRTPN